MITELLILMAMIQFLAAIGCKETGWAITNTLMCCLYACGAALHFAGVLA